MKQKKNVSQTQGKYMEEIQMNRWDWSRYWKCKQTREMEKRRQKCAKMQQSKHRQNKVIFIVSVRRWYEVATVTLKFLYLSSINWNLHFNVTTIQKQNGTKVLLNVYSQHKSCCHMTCVCSAPRNLYSDYWDRNKFSVTFTIWRVFSHQWIYVLI